MAWEIDEERSNILFATDGKRLIMTAPSGRQLTMEEVWAYLAGGTNQQINATHLRDALSGYAPDMTLYLLKDVFEKAFTLHFKSDGSLESIQANAGLWTNYFMTAKGAGSGGGGGGGGMDINQFWQLLREGTSEQINASHLVNALSSYVLSSSLSSVAKSGKYSDLSGRPALKPVATSGSYEDLTNKPALKPVATSGSYEDLTNRPSLDFLPISGGTLTGDLTMPNGKKIKFTSGYFSESANGNVYYNDGARTMLAFDSVNNAVRRGTAESATDTTFGTTSYPWSKIFAKDGDFSGIIKLSGTTKRIDFGGGKFIELDENGRFHFSADVYGDGAMTAKGAGSGGGVVKLGVSWEDLGTNETDKVINKAHLPTDFKNPSKNSVIAYSVQILNNTPKGEENTAPSGSYVNSTWCAMFPITYDPKGKPSPVCALLHGGGGHCTTGFMGYSDGNANGWSNFKSRLLSDGYVIFDINGYGSYASNVETANHYGCPRAVETMKKAFEYLKDNYNVEHKMSIVAVSMGGALLMSYTMNYPSDVIACASLAPINLQYSMSSAKYVAGDITSSRNRVAVAFGYSDYTDMASDNMSNAVGFSPVMSAQRYTSNGAYIPAMDWSKYTYRKTYPSVSSEDYQEVKERIDYCRGYNFAFRLPVPVRFWHGDADTINGIGMSRDTIAMLRNGGSNATLRVCPNLSHEDVHGKIRYVVNEVSDWLKRIR